MRFGFRIFFVLELLVLRLAGHVTQLHMPIDGTGLRVLVFQNIVDSPIQNVNFMHIELVSFMALQDEDEGN